jgi:hypothetical protein
MFDGAPMPPDPQQPMTAGPLEVWFDLWLAIWLFFFLALLISPRPVSDAIIRIMFPFLPPPPRE